MTDCILNGEMNTITSSILEDDRKYIVYLPEGYEMSEERYSVLVVVNANYNPYFAHAASVTQLLSGTRIPPMIVVGIHTPDHAIDFFHVPHPRIQNSGKAEYFLRFITDELLPLIEKTYRTNTFRVLYGQSNGGMFTVYSLLKNPDSFNAYIAGSPMLGWGSEFFMEKGKEMFNSDSSLKRFLYMEYGENDYDRVVTTVPDFAAIIEKNTPHDFVWKWRTLKGEAHAPISVLYNGLSLIFPRWQMTTEEGMKEGLEGVERFYANLSQKYGIEIKLPSEVLSDIGVNWIMKEQPEMGRPFLERMVELYPHHEGGYYLLGIVEERMENFSKAVEFYRRSLEINPDYPPPRDKIANLESEGRI
ncbi:MAG: alpha/beta hydrolase-fold protein [Candidatus Thorarchaeota archaeon]